MKECKHNYEYKSETVKLLKVNKGWYEAKRVIIFCKNCGKVTRDATNDENGASYNYSKD